MVARKEDIGEEGLTREKFAEIMQNILKMFQDNDITHAQGQFILAQTSKFI